MKDKDLGVLDPLDTGLATGIPRDTAPQNPTSKEVDKKEGNPPKNVVGGEAENPLENIYFTS